MKKIFKRGFIYFMAMLSFAAFTACAETPNKPVNPDNNPYDILGLGEMPIGMWVTPPAGFKTDEVFREMSESGINFINGFQYYEPTYNDIRLSLDLAYKYDMKYLVNDMEVSQLIASYYKDDNPLFVTEAMNLIERYYQHPAYAGQLLVDEPGRAQFEALNDFIDAYTKNYPGKQWHVNMFPLYARGALGVSYERYVDDWINLVSPNYYSYDSYPLNQYSEDDYVLRPEIEEYFYNLDILRVKTREKNIPLWSFIQTLGYSSNPDVLDKREPSREDIRWQVFVNLAFGVKGIQYFCYWTPSGGAEYFEPALVDTAGNKTERYYYVKELNNEFKDFGKLLLNTHADGIIFNKQLSGNLHKLYSEPLTSFGSIKSVDGDTFVAGCFTDRSTEQKSVLIVSTTPRDAITAKLTFDSTVKTVTAYINGKREQLSVNNSVLEIEVEIGDAVYIIL